jgi:hypothetical protein
MKAELTTHERETLEKSNLHSVQTILNEHLSGIYNETYVCDESQIHKIIQMSENISEGYQPNNPKDMMGFSLSVFRSLCKVYNNKPNHFNSTKKAAEVKRALNEINGTINAIQDLINETDG